MSLGRGPLPPGWCWTTLDEIADIQGGLALGKKRKEEQALRRVPYLRVANVQRGFLDMNEVKEVAATPQEIESLQLLAGDVLFNEGGDRDKLGRGWIWSDELPTCIHQNHVFRARLRTTQIQPEYISLYGNALGPEYFADQGKQTTNLASLSLTKLSNFPIPLPPAAEQRRIVAKLEDLLARSHRAKEAIDAIPALLERFRQSVLAAAFRGDLTADWRAQHPDVEPASKLLERIHAERRRRWEEAELERMRSNGKTPKDNGWKSKCEEPTPANADALPMLPRGWCWATLDSLLLSLRNGIAVKPDKDSGLPILRISAVRPLAVDLGDVRYLEDTDDHRNYLLRDGDLLFTRYNGNQELVGACAVVRRLERDLVYPDKLIRGRTVDALVLPEFIAAAVTTSISRQFIASKSKSAAGQVGISGSDLRSTPIPLAPLAEQEMISKKIGEAFSRAAHVGESIFEALGLVDQNQKALLAKAFRGELVEQDPNDEPAETLLARLRAEKAAAKDAPARSSKTRRRTAAD